MLSNKEKILSPLKMKHGYIFYRLSIGCKSKTELCHRLVAKYFIDNPNSLPQVDHIDENKANNSVYNLQWITAKDNTSKSQSKKIRQINLVNNDVVEWESISEASRKLGFNKANISKCLTGKKPTMYKSKWEYVY